MADDPASCPPATMGSMLDGEGGPSDQRDVDQHLVQSALDRAPADVLNISDGRLTKDEPVKELVDIVNTSTGKKRKIDRKQQQAEEQATRARNRSMQRS